MSMFLVLKLDWTIQNFFCYLNEFRGKIACRNDEKAIERLQKKFMFFHIYNWNIEYIWRYKYIYSIEHVLVIGCLRLLPYWSEGTKITNVLIHFQKQSIFSDEFNHNGRNVIFTAGELQSHLNGTICPHCGQYSNAQIQIHSLSSTIPAPPSLLSSSEPQLPHRSTNGCPTVAQSEDKHHVAKDCIGKEQRKLTR